MSDTLVKGIASDAEALRKIVIADNALNQERLQLRDFVKNPDIVQQKVTAYLRSILYHNIGKADFLYRTAFGVRLLDESIDKAELFRAIQYRHDCVHRNRVDKEGVHLDIFTKEYVQKTADMICSLVNSVEAELTRNDPIEDMVI